MRQQARHAPVCRLINIAITALLISFQMFFGLKLSIDKR